MIYRLSKVEIKKITSPAFENISQGDKNEMAIPTYLHHNPLIKWLFWKRYEKIAKLGNFNKNMSVLEFGCGIGVFLPTLSNFCGKVYAVDLFPQYAQKLVKEKNLSVTFIENVAEIQDRSLDIIIAADVMEHIENTETYLDLFRTKLKNNGKFIISGPTENKIYKIGRTVAGFGNLIEYHHTNIHELIKNIEQCGFHLIKGYNLPFRFPPYLFKVLEFSK